MELPLDAGNLASNLGVAVAAGVAALIWLSLARRLLLRLLRRVSGILCALLRSQERVITARRRRAERQYLLQLARRANAWRSGELARQLRWFETRETDSVVRGRVTEDRLETLVSALTRRVESAREEQPGYLSREEAQTALTGWRRVIRLQGDLGRLVREEAAAESRLARELSLLRQQLTRGHPARADAPALVNVLLGFAGVILVLIAAGWLLFPGVAALAPGLSTVQTIGVQVALFLALSITVQAFLSGARATVPPYRLVRFVGAILLLAWTVVLAMLAQSRPFPQAASGVPSLVPVLQALLGGAIPWWLVLLSGVSPRLAEVPMQITASLADVVFALLAGLIQVIRAAVMIVESLLVGAINALTLPVRLLFRLFSRSRK